MRTSRARAARGACSTGSACPRRPPSRSGTRPRGRSGAASGRRDPDCPRRPRSPRRRARRARPRRRAGSRARAGRRSGTRSGTRTGASSGSITSPVDFRRNSRRSSMYSSPRRRASATPAEPPIARSCSSRPSRTLIVVPNDDTVAPFSTSQFQPPSGSCSPRSRSTSGVMSTPKYAPVATTLPLMHGSTSPSKNRLSAHGVSNSGVPPGDVLADEADRPAGPARSRDRARTAAGAPGRGTCRSSPATTAVPAHRPSGAWSASSRAPQPSVATRDRSAATTSAGSCVRSRITCQRIAGSESSSQSMTVMFLPRPLRRSLRSRASCRSYR